MMVFVGKEKAKENNQHPDHIKQTTYEFSMEFFCSNGFNYR
jgi:hypothetical protein